MPIEDTLALGRTYLRYSQSWKNYLRAGGPGIAHAAYVENVAAATIDIDETYARFGFDLDHVLQIKAEAIRDARRRIAD